MPTKPRLAVYALIWVGFSAAVYPLLPKLKYAPPPSNTTTVSPDTAADAKRLALAPTYEPPKEEPQAPRTKPDTPKKVPETPKTKLEPPKQVPETPKKEPEPPKKEPETPKKEPEPPKKVPETPQKEPEPRKKVLLPEVLIGKERRLDRPDGAYTVEPLVLRQKIRITGKVKTLTVGRIDSDSGLDASELEAQEIVVLNAIDTRSRVKLLAPRGRVVLRGKLDGDSHLDITAPNGTIEIRGKVDTRSRLTIDAPNGRVLFTEPTANGKDGSKIDGDAKVFITAQEVEFHGKIDTRARVEVNAPEGRVTFAEPTTKGNAGSKICGDAKVTITTKTVDFRGLIDGQNTRAFVTLTKEGVLKFAQVDGGAYIGYKKADASHPEPTIDSGRTTKKGQLRKSD